MRILQVSTSEFGGGAEGSARHLFLECRRRGHDSWLAVGEKSSDDPDVFVIPNEEHRPVWTRLCRGIRARGKQGSLRRITNLVGKMALLGEPGRLLRRLIGLLDVSFPGTRYLLDLPPHRPDVLHCHNLHGGYFDLRELPRLSRTVPTVLNLRDLWLLTGWCPLPFDCQRWQGGCGRCPRLSLFLDSRRDNTARNWREKSSIYAASRLYLTAPSQWTADRVAQSMLGANEVRVIPNGIDTSVFCPGDREAARLQVGLPLDIPIVLFSANGIRVNPWKDYGTIEAACQSLSAEFNGRFLCVCLGAGNDEEPTLPFMRFVPFLRDPSEVAKYHQAADVYVHAAKQEVFGKTITESLACGNPVVATNVGGISEQIREGETGFLVPPGDALGITQAVSRLFRDDAVRKRMGEAASRDVTDRFSLARQADSFLAWYEEIIADWTDWKGKCKDRP